MKVAICIPCYSDPKYSFVLSLLALQRAVLLDGTFELGIVAIQNEVIDRARRYLVEKALEERVDYLLWLDSDMTFPSDALARLASHNLPVVGANYRKRSFQTRSSSAHMREGEAYRPIKPKDDGLEEVDMVGLGLCLMKADVFNELPRPWFSSLPMGEDTFFFRRLHEAKGIRPVVDHRLSAEVGHVAEAVLMF